LILENLLEHSIGGREVALSPADVREQQGVFGIGRLQFHRPGCSPSGGQQVI
jgi:hypothetical protein